MATKVRFTRRSTTEIESLPIIDGQLIYNHENGNIYMDYGIKRVVLAPNAVTSVNEETGDITINLNNLNAEEKGIAAGLISTHLSDYDHSKLAIISNSGDIDKYLNEQGNYVQISIPDGSKWESDGLDKIKPKDDKSIDYSIILNPPTIPVVSDFDIKDLTDSTNLRTAWSGKQDALGFTPEDSGNKVTSFQATPDNTKYPSEKLVKDSLDGKQEALVSGTNIKTINSASLLGSGNINISSGGGGGLTWVSKTADYTVSSGEGVLADTSSSGWTLTLPATPTAGDFIGVSDAKSSFGTNNLTIDRNGSLIHSEAENLVVDLKDASFQLIYTGATTGWKLDTFLEVTTENKIATGAEINTGTDNEKTVTPKAIADSWIETGWIPARETWEYASVDNPTGVFTISGDVSSKYSTGMRLKMTNGGNTIYGIITAVSYSSPNTSITFLHEINPSNSQALNLMANSAITNPFYSTQKIPSGFPSKVTSWSMYISVVGGTQQDNPVQHQWYHLNSNIKIDLPIGNWMVEYRCAYFGEIAGGVAGQLSLYASLSTSNNSESSSSLTSVTRIDDIKSFNGSEFLSTFIDNSSKTTYYLITKTGGTNLSRINITTVAVTYIKASLSYL